MLTEQRAQRVDLARLHNQIKRINDYLTKDESVIHPDDEEETEIGPSNTEQ